MDEPDQHPLGDQVGLPSDHGIEEAAVIACTGRIMPGDRVVGQRLYCVPIALRGEILERSNPDVARRDAGEDRTGQGRLPLHHLARGDGGQGPGGRDAERMHGLAKDVFPQHRAYRRPPVPAARERRPARSLELDVEAPAVGREDLTKQ